MNAQADFNSKYFMAYAIPAYNETSQKDRPLIRKTNRFELLGIPASRYPVFLVVISLIADQI